MRQTLTLLASTLLLQRGCVLCGDVVGHCEDLGAVCSVCFSSLPFLLDSFCLRCGLPLNEGEGDYCASCLFALPVYDLCRSVFLYEEKGEDLVKTFKYGGNWRLCAPLSRMLADYYEKHLSRASYDFVLYVPTHFFRNLKRGYNQSYLLAERFSKETGIPLLIEGVIKPHSFVSQARLNREKRQQNQRHAFEGGKNLSAIAGKRVLLIDDVVTTGSTIAAVTEILKTAAPAFVHVLSLARTPLLHSASSAGSDSP